MTAAGRQVAAGERVEAAFIVESSHDAIVGVTRDGVVCQWNPAAERLYGYPDGEIIGRSAETLGSSPAEWCSALARDLSLVAMR